MDNNCEKVHPQQDVYHPQGHSELVDEQLEQALRTGSNYEAILRIRRIVYELQAELQSLSDRVTELEK